MTQTMTFTKERAHMATPIRCRTIRPPRQRPLGLDGAAALISATPDEVLTLVAERRANMAALGAAQPWDIPEPYAEWWWNGRELELWAWRVGRALCHGRPVIGYAGIAHRLNRLEQSLRKLGLGRWGVSYRDGRLVRAPSRAAADVMARKARGARVVPVTTPEAMPGPIVRVAVSPTLSVVLFDPESIVDWAVQTSRLAPDRVTPIHRRPNGQGRTIAPAGPTTIT